MASEMEERVAEILVEADGVELPSGVKRTLAQCSEGQRRSYLRTATRITTAIREPTDAMVAAAADILKIKVDRRLIEGVWRSMIDEALKCQ